MSSVATEEKFNNFQRCAILSRNKAYCRITRRNVMLLSYKITSPRDQRYPLKWCFVAANLFLFRISVGQVYKRKFSATFICMMIYSVWGVYAVYVREKGSSPVRKNTYFVLESLSLFLFVKEIKTKETIETKSFINCDVYPFMMPDTRKWQWYKIL